LIKIQYLYVFAIKTSIYIQEITGGCPKAGLWFIMVSAGFRNLSHHWSNLALKLLFFSDPKGAIFIRQDSWKITHSRTTQQFFYAVVWLYGYTLYSVLVPNLPMFFCFQPQFLTHAPFQLLNSKPCHLFDFSQESPCSAAIQHQSSVTYYCWWIVHVFGLDYAHYAHSEAVVAPCRTWKTIF
jgi:hypothetical protein